MGDAPKAIEMANAGAGTPFGNGRRVVDTTFRVRYAETDAMGVVHHANYFVWFEAGRTEYTRAAGLPYRQVEDDGVRLVVVEARAEFKRPARYDDPVVVRTTVGEITKATLTFRYEVRLQSDDTLLVTGSTVHAATDRDGRMMRMPDRVREAMSGTLPS